MSEIIYIIIGVAYIIYSKVKQNQKLDKHDINKLDIGKMAMDAEKSPSEIRRNLVKGKYDKMKN